MAEWGPAAVMAVALVATWAAVTARGRRRGDGRPMVPSDLGPFPGVLLFTSDTCDSCGPARDVVARVTGGRFSEYTWQVHPGIHGRLRIDRVPTTWVVDADGRLVEAFEGIATERRLRESVG